jgi:hypothetical protein
VKHKVGKLQYKRNGFGTDPMRYTPNASMKHLSFNLLALRRLNHLTLTSETIAKTAKIQMKNQQFKLSIVDYEKHLSRQSHAGR